MAARRASAYNEAYNYASVAPERSPRFQVIPGRGSKQRQSGLSLNATFLVWAFVAGVLLFSLLGFVRVSLGSATVSTALSSEEIQAQIDAARSLGNELEVQQSYLSNPEHIKMLAASLDMSAAEETLEVVLPKDVVVCDEAGNLSLSSSIKAASAA